MEYTAGKGTTALGVVGTVLGSIGTAAATGVLNNGLGLFNNGANACSENMVVSRYELGLHQANAALQNENALLKADKYTDQKIADLNDRYNDRFRVIEAQLAQQAVTNAQVVANISCMQGSINTLMGLTKTIVPITNVCPQPMPEFNSWTAPTAAAAGG